MAASFITDTVVIRKDDTAHYPTNPGGGAGGGGSGQLPPAGAFAVLYDGGPTGEILGQPVSQILSTDIVYFLITYVASLTSVEPIPVLFPWAQVTYTNLSGGTSVDIIGLTPTDNGNYAGYWLGARNANPFNQTVWTLGYTTGVPSQFTQLDEGYFDIVVEPVLRNTYNLIVTVGMWANEAPEGDNPPTYFDNYVVDSCPEPPDSEAAPIEGYFLLCHDQRIALNSTDGSITFAVTTWPPVLTTPGNPEDMFVATGTFNMSQIAPLSGDGSGLFVAPFTVVLSQVAGQYGYVYQYEAQTTKTDSLGVVTVLDDTGQYADHWGTPPPNWLITISVDETGAITMTNGPPP